MIRLELDPTSGSLHVRGNDTSVELFAGPRSWVYSAISSLADAVINLLSGLENARAFWNLDPGQFRWLFERHGEHAVVRILEFGDGFTNVDDSHGEHVFETACRLADLAGQTLSVVHSINDQVEPQLVDTTLGTQERLLRQLIRQRKRLGPEQRSADATP